MPQHKGGKKGKDRRSYHNKLIGKYSRQRLRTEQNKKKRRKLHLKNNPNDLQNKEILKQLV